MNTTTAAQTAKVTVATIRDWARRGIIAATKVAGRWVIDTTSLAHRISIGARRAALKVAASYDADSTASYIEEVQEDAIHSASTGSTAALKQLLGWVKTRNVAAVMGHQFDCEGVYLTADQWSRLERCVSLQLGCVGAER